jgi:hypothetical protein
MALISNPVIVGTCLFIGVMLVLVVSLVSSNRD